MPEAAAYSFHLLRPLWLLALVPVAAVMALVLWRQSINAQWGGVIARHLLTNLIVRPQRKWSIDPIYLIAAGMTLAIFALSGPTWKRELPPFVEDKAPLMIALAVSSSMGETDVAPSRLERAKAEGARSARGACGRTNRADRLCRHRTSGDAADGRSQRGRAVS